MNLRENDESRLPKLLAAIERVPDVVRPDIVANLALRIQRSDLTGVYVQGKE